MVQRLAVGVFLVALLGVLGVLSMHAVEAHASGGLDLSAPLDGVHSHVDRALPPGLDHVPADSPGMASTDASHEPPTGAHGNPDHPLASTHAAMCAAIVVAGSVAIRAACAGRRLLVADLGRLVTTALALDPPVPRCALAFT